MEEQDEEEREIIMKMLGVPSNVMLGKRNETHARRIGV